jgi:hypothetical protein
VVLASRCDLAFLQFNPVWVVVLLTVAVIGFVAAAARLAGRAGSPRRRPGPAAWRYVIMVCLAAGWACALLHRQAIAGT